jgi:hypothetical protein
MLQLQEARYFSRDYPEPRNLAAQIQIVSNPNYIAEDKDQLASRKSENYYA